MHWQVHNIYRKPDLRISFSLLKDCVWCKRYYNNEFTYGEVHDIPLYILADNLALHCIRNYKDLDMRYTKELLSRLKDDTYIETRRIYDSCKDSLKLFPELWSFIEYYYNGSNNVDPKCFNTRYVIKELLRLIPLMNHDIETFEVPSLKYIQLCLSRINTYSRKSQTMNSTGMYVKALLKEFIHQVIPCEMGLLYNIIPKLQERHQKFSLTLSDYILSAFGLLFDGMHKCLPFKLVNIRSLYIYHLIELLISINGEIQTMSANDFHQRMHNMWKLYLPQMISFGIIHQWQFKIPIESLLSTHDRTVHDMSLDEQLMVATY